MIMIIEFLWMVKIFFIFNFLFIIFIGFDVLYLLEWGLCVWKVRFYKNNNVNYICFVLNCFLLMMFLWKRKKSINYYKNCCCLCLVFGMMYMYIFGIWLLYLENIDLYRFYNRVFLIFFILFLIVLRMLECGNVVIWFWVCLEMY